MNELNKKVEQLRMKSQGKMKYLRAHSRLLDQAFEELEEVTESELDIINAKIRELDDRLHKNGL